jgi:hypothetical protein
VNRFLALVVIGSALAGCGNQIKKNIEACEGWNEALASACEGADVSAIALDCTVYDNEAYKKCDIAPYFDCLTENTACDEATSIVTVDVAACAAEASCE